VVKKILTSEEHKGPDSYVILQNFGNRMFDVLYMFIPPFFFPQGGKVLTPSPVGEVPIAIGREGG
jgi:hypothetical protein